jgi:hypothetical protein
LAPVREIDDTPLSFALIDFSRNSANFANLQTLEEKIVALERVPVMFEHIRRD